MRFRSLTFRCFGPFEEQTLDLSGAGGMHLIFGLNEAGKSCSLRGLLAFLFGFPQSGDDFRFKYSQFRVQAVLENGAGQTLECIRRKGNRDTLRKADDKTVLAEQDLSAFLGGLDEARFKQLFGLDAGRLVEGGQDIVDGKGELGEALFAAGAGMKGLRALSRKLEERQRDLYRSAGKNQKIAEMLRQYKELSLQVSSLSLPSERYAAAEAAARDGEERVASLGKERAGARTRSEMLTRYRAALPTIQLYRNARAELEPLADAPLLSQDFDDRFRKGSEERQLAGQTLTDVVANKEAFEAQLREAEPLSQVLDAEVEIDRLRELYGADLKQRDDRQREETFRIKEEADARDIYRELAGSKDWERMDAWKPRREERNQITELSNRRAAVFQDVERQRDSERAALQELRQLEELLVASEAAPDSEQWKAVVDPILKMGPLEEQARKKLLACSESERQLIAEFSRFAPAIPGSWNDAAALRLPSSEAVTQFGADLKKGREAAQDALRQLERVDHEIAELEGRLIEVHGAEPIPSVEELHKSRSCRDGGLWLVRRRLAGATEQGPETEFIARYAPGRELMDATEAAVRDCDHGGDRLRHEADRVAMAQTIRHQIQALRDSSVKLAQDVQSTADALSATQVRWQSAWASSGIVPETPEVMQPWLIRWQSWCARKAAWDQMREECRAEEQRIRELHQQVVAACDLDVSIVTLAKALESAQRQIAKATAAGAARTKLADDHKRAHATHTAAGNALRLAETKRDDWMAEWKRAVVVLRLTDDNPPVKTVQDYLMRLDEMHVHLVQSRLKAARVRQIDGDRASLLERLTALRLRLSPTAQPTTNISLDADFRALEVAVRDATERRTRRKQLSHQLEQEKKKEGEVTTRLRKAEAALTTLAAEAGVADIASIPVAIQRARRRAEIAKQVSQYKDALAQNTRGGPMDEFMESALGCRDSLDEELKELDQRLTQLDEEITGAEAVSREAKRILEGYRQASDAAADARQQLAMLNSRLEDHVAEYAALQVARTSLERAKERYRARHQDTLLDKAGAFFQTLTDGAFAGIEIENEEGADVLKAVRAAPGRPDARVSVEGLSDGTRDQLFLALRLAGIERHLNDRAPVPLIIDDVLINFDDTRARSTLTCLAEMAKRTQVLVFTHHRHVIELARAIDPTAVVHELSCAKAGRTDGSSSVVG